MGIFILNGNKIFGKISGSLLALWMAACGSEATNTPNPTTAPASTTTAPLTTASTTFTTTTAPPTAAATTAVPSTSVAAFTTAPAATTAAPTTTDPAVSMTTAATTNGVSIAVIKDFYSKALNNSRRVDIYLPPGYNSSNERYKVLYMHDGQDTYVYNPNQLMEKLIEANQMEKIILVAIFNTPSRLSEYGTAGTPNSKGMGDKAQSYTDFVIGEVMPYVKKNYRVLEGPTNTAIMGSSLGGLMAFDMAWKHPDVFGKVGVFSGSFWWRTEDSSSQAQQDSRIMHKTVRESPKREGLKMWFEAGTQDETSDRDGNGVIDAIQDTTELMDVLKTKGYQPNIDMTYVQIEGGKHDQSTWAKALPDFLKWAFPVK